MPITENLSSGKFTIRDRISSMRIRMYGAGGGGEYISNDINLTSTAGTSGGSTSFLGLTAGGGVGGGIGGKNSGGSGGTTSVSYDWTNFGATITTNNGNRGQFNAGGNGGVVSTNRVDGGSGTEGIFEYTSRVDHTYYNPPPPATPYHVFTNSSPDLVVGFLGGEGTDYCGTTAAHKHYTVRFDVPFVDTNFRVLDIYGYNWENDLYGESFAKKAAGGSDEGPFTVTSGPNSTKNTLIYTAEDGWLTFRVDSLMYEVGVSTSTIYTNWGQSTYYPAGSYVVYQSLVYKAIFANSGNNPADKPVYWKPLTIQNRVSYFRVFFCRNGQSTYISWFKFLTQGKKQGAVGRGGGGGAALETTLTRQMLVDSSTYAPNTTHTATIGSSGFRGGSTASDGGLGVIELYQLIIPSVSLTSTKTTLINGESATLSWTVSGDADSIEWTSGNLSNTNVTSNEVVYPTETTTYTAVANGIAGKSNQLPDPNASVKITVYQRPTATLDVPDDILYGNNLIISFTTQYANKSITITPYYTYLAGGPTGEEQGNSIVYEILAKTAEIGTSEDTIVSNTAFSISIPYGNFGPSNIRLVMTVVGDGGSITLEKSIPVVIDVTPDNLIIQETDDLYKNQEPVYTPETEILSAMYLIDGIDIPVEIKANYPIQVDINHQRVWRNLRQL